jgi:SNF2 family DNA or RNA helicase
VCGQDSRQPTTTGGRGAFSRGTAGIRASLRPGITLRPHQEQGFNWLAFLYRFGLNGILADDMGLGITLQTLAILQRAKEQGQGKSPSLIICPTSAVNNRHFEAEKFFTDCQVLLYTGAMCRLRFRSSDLELYGR